MLLLLLLIVTSAVTMTTTTTAVNSHCGSNNTGQHLSFRVVSKWQLLFLFFSQKQYLCPLVSCYYKTNYLTTAALMLYNERRIFVDEKKLESILPGASCRAFFLNYHLADRQFTRLKVTVLLSFSSTAIRHPPLPTTISLIYSLRNCLGCAVVVGARESPIDLRVD